MKIVLPGKIEGSLQAPSSKSMAQRAVAAAALADGESSIGNFSDCEDALAAVRCAKALGAEVNGEREKLLVRGGGKPEKGAILHCGESGLCMRMFAPIAALFDKEIVITGKGSLLSRQVGMLQQPLEKLGASCSTSNGLPPVVVKGPMNGGSARVDGSGSSQFVTGLLMALPLCKEGSVLQVSNLKSKPYVGMTLELLGKFGVDVEHGESLAMFEISGGQEYRPAAYAVEGDWSGAAFLLVAGAIAGKVNASGLRNDSLQADRAIVDALERAGANVSVRKDAVTCEQSELSAFEFDATDCPDLFPPLVALACCCKGKTVLKGAGRLKGKESDRAETLAQEFGKIGGKVRVEGDMMEIEGGKLMGGEADSRNDHRIAMALAVAALNSEKGVRISSPACVAKSYPRFFEDLDSVRA